jgi:hypothetical protein
MRPSAWSISFVSPALFSIVRVRAVRSRRIDASAVWMSLVSSRTMVRTSSFVAVGVTTNVTLSVSFDFLALRGEALLYDVRQRVDLSLQ